MNEFGRSPGDQSRIGKREPTVKMTLEKHKTGSGNERWLQKIQAFLKKGEKPKAAVSPSTSVSPSASEAIISASAIKKVTKKEAPTGNVPETPAELPRLQEKPPFDAADIQMPVETIPETSAEQQPPKENIYAAELDDLETDIQERIREISSGTNSRFDREGSEPFDFIQRYKTIAESIGGDKDLQSDLLKEYVDRIALPKLQAKRDGELDDIIATYKEDKDPQKLLDTIRYFPNILSREARGNLQKSLNLPLERMIIEIAAKNMDALYHAYAYKDVLNFSFSDFTNNIIVTSQAAAAQEDNFTWEVVSGIQRGTDGLPTEWVEGWQIIKASPKVNEIFEDLVQQKDDAYYQRLVEASLSDHEGDVIDLLENYPRPEAIRNLVLFASNPDSGFQHIHANNVLSELAQRADWGKVLTETEQTYPELAKARPILLAWQNTGQEENPLIQNAAADFILSVVHQTEMEEGKVDKKLNEIAVSALPNASLLQLLAERGVIEATDATALTEAGAILSEKGFNFKYIKPNLLYLTKTKPGSLYERHPFLELFNKFAMLGREVVANKDNKQVLEYLTATAVVSRLKETSCTAETYSLLLEGYKDCPDLLTERRFIRPFCEHVNSEEDVTFFADFMRAYGEQDDDNALEILQIAYGTPEDQLSRERILALPQIAADVLASDAAFRNISAASVFYLGTDEGLALFRHLQRNGLSDLDPALNASLGKPYFEIRSADNFRQKDFSASILHDVQNNVAQQLDQTGKITDSNWQSLLLSYVITESPDSYLPQMDEASQEKLKALFADPNTRDFCLTAMRKEWYTYTKNGNPENIPFSLQFINDVIKECGDAGPLSQVESLSSLISITNTALFKETTAPHTKTEIIQGLAKMEERFDKERWSNEERTDFYDISRDIIAAAPSLFSTYVTLFDKMNASQIKRFAKELYPTYQTKLVLLENDKKEHDIHALVAFRKDIRALSESLHTEEKPFEKEKERLLENVKNLAQERFGIIKLPQEFTSEHVKSFTNVSMYLSNLRDRTPIKEAELGFYLALMANNRWDDFKQGKEINPKEFLVPEKSEIMQRILADRKQLNPLTAENLGISKEDMPEFTKLLQQETQTLRVGDIETIDVKLNNIILNLRGLEDLDLYADPMDKKRMKLLIDWGNKKVGGVVAKMYQRANGSTNSIQFSDEERRLEQQVTQIIAESGLELTPTVLKEQFQNRLKPLATVANLVKFIEETNAESEIESLHEFLKPSEEVISIFQRLGEDFKPTSGAMALSQDLQYLDTLIVKREDELKPDERQVLTEYITQIRDRVVNLESVYDKIKNKFVGLQQGNNHIANDLLQEKLAEINKIVTSQATQQVITSTSTDNLNTIIENIRECLSCTRKGANNDTNLTLGDTNKFYLYSQSENQRRGSIADQLVFVEPIIHANNSKEMAFVLDTIYGTNTPSVLEGQLDVIMKKARLLKERFPFATLTIFLPEFTIRTGGTSPSMFLDTLKAKDLTARSEEVTINVAESAFGDHYIEFGGDVRTSGERKVTGLTITL